jgi:hypothetical protein
MPRQARAAPGGFVYHALNRAVARLPLLQKDGDREAFERVLVEAVAKPQVCGAIMKRVFPFAIFYAFMTIVGTCCFISARLSVAQTATETPKEIPFVNTKNSFSEIPKQILQKTESIEVLSLDPSEEKAKTKEQGFYQYKVLGSTIVKEKDIKLKLTEGINKGVRESHMSEIGLCLIPRHGLRAKWEGKTQAMKTRGSHFPGLRRRALALRAPYRS